MDSVISFTSRSKKQIAIPSTSGMAVSQEGSVPQWCLCCVALPSTAEPL